MPKRRSVINVEKLRRIVKRVEDNEKKRKDTEHNRKIADAIKEAKRLIKEIPMKLLLAAKNGEQSVLVLKQYDSDYRRFTARKIIDFCNSNGLGYECLVSRDELGYICDFLYVNFRYH